VLPQTGIDDANKIFERIREAVSLVDIGGKNGSFTATVSIGISEFVQGDDLGGILSRAEEAVAKAKSEGNNLVKTV
jgi:PleD family two-component response regulator